MAAANESQGLKIAVAMFVSLSVILGVACYFLYSNYDQSVAKQAAAEEKARGAQKAAGDALTQYDDMKKQIGSRAEEFDAVKSEIKTADKKISDEIAAIGPMVVDIINKVQAAGGTSPAIEEIKSTAQGLLSAYQTEPNKTYISALARLTDMLKNQARLSATLSTSFIQLKNNIESVNTIHKQQIDVVQKAHTDAKSDVESEQTKHVKAREELLAKVDQYQTEINNKATEIATLNTKLRQLTESSSKQVTDLLNQVRELRDLQAQKENVLDRPDGAVTFVDYGRGEIRTNVTYNMGARPQMHLTIFDRHAPGIPTEKPKGTIEMTYVGDSYSIARIVKTVSAIDPIRVGDIVYSPAWSPNEPMRFALIGKMDVNRDGKDDRGDLIRMIQTAGGIVDYDLPPPYAGKERGKITGRDAWYVIDDPKLRPPLRTYESRDEDLETPENAEFLKKRSSAIREARDNGVRPMPIGRLLNYLGYDYTAPIRGRVDAIDRKALKDLSKPKAGEAGKAKGAPGAPAEESSMVPKEEPKEEAMPKEEK